MATPLNTTIENVPYCVRQLTSGGKLNLYNRNGTSGICPGTQSGAGNYRCCGIHDTCLGYGMCYRENAGAGKTGFYVAGCNDPSYQDNTACLKICTSQARPDVVWESKLGVWMCCGADASGKATCEAPTTAVTGDAFLAPGPDALMGMMSNETINGVAVGRATVTATHVTPFATATGGAHSGDHGISKVATAGIAIGVIVPVVLIGVVAFIFFQRRKAVKKSRHIEMLNSQQWHK